MKNTSIVDVAGSNPCLPCASGISSTDQDLTEMPVLEAWLRMCCETPELVSNYNRLSGTKISFTVRPMSGIEAIVDRACGHVPTLNNDPEELDAFLGWCRDTLLRLPMLLLESK